MGSKAKSGLNLSMNYKLIENVDLDMSFLKNTLDSEEEMSLVNPSARFPFEESYWLNFYKLENRKSYSLLYLDSNKVIAHAALQQNNEENGIVHLCFVVLDKNYRGSGVSLKFLSEVEEFLKKNFAVDKYYLNVREFNIPAIRCYKKFGFTDYLKRESSFKMVKFL